jgi:hypothetical protein
MKKPMKVIDAGSKELPASVALAAAGCLDLREGWPDGLHELRLRTPRRRLSWPFAPTFFWLYSTICG